MSVETIAIVISSATLLLGFVGAFGWMIRRTDARADHLEARLEARIDQVEQKLEARIDRLDEKVDGVGRELVEVKIAVARLEGPQRHLVTAR